MTLLVFQLGARRYGVRLSSSRVLGRGIVGRGRPGRRVRGKAVLHDGRARSVKAWARTTDDGRAWLERKRRSS